MTAPLTFTLALRRRKAMRKGGDPAFEATMDVINAFSQGKVPDVVLDRTFQQTVWDDYIDIAERYNEPGRFTTVIGYEWTSTENGNNLHRNVLYRDDGNRARRMVPYTTAESFNPEDLWKWMGRYEEATGGRVLALAHNGNMSNGIMFPVEKSLLRYCYWPTTVKECEECEPGE